MKQIIARTRKWGNSVGVVIPNNILKEQGIKDGQEIIITITSRGKTTVGDIFEMLKKHSLPEKKDKRSTQEILDEIDKELEPEMFN